MVKAERDGGCEVQEDQSLLSVVGPPHGPGTLTDPAFLPWFLSLPPDN